ncbi:YwqI/YxiC family protein [Bacillus atrophaeus]|uniref:YwqI/YxiC family protein n=1 Tax=Bacillus atrophaeus TaxID=1452 RepID=UPI002DBB8A60|nr:YwqI/YxiC family protein [Bacillus atrophaeus]MEC1901614.1 YwqI/YxiC family protein [Bacillus atrophaeus]MEC2398398.1 YwqI/YxiC family protein [Bacillus atrophaeus]MED4436674.1 YwqI/YxiC family protein [Bacillus atrophaeus]MED4564472.1 YwqI/YxiC family protein [Bacillus atrophaeus]MED4574680.1 YwqI/YxiC family protein [Bacillus atrophaeus]
MSEIKQKYDTVIKTLESVKDALADVTIGAAGSNGKNKLDYTSKYDEREENIRTMLGDYKKAVHKNIEDTKDNVDSLKEQDEAIAVK